MKVLVISNNGTAVHGEIINETLVRLRNARIFHLEGDVDLKALLKRIEIEPDAWRIQSMAVPAVVGIYEIPEG
jgi:hypothetical protein